jgi:hypothetical protein
LGQAEEDVYVQFWSCITGPVFWAGVALAVGILVIIAIVEGFSLGSGFLIGVAVGLLITGALAGLSLAHINLGPINNAKSPPGAQMTSFFEGFANNTTGHPPSTNNSTAYRGYHDNTTSSCNWGNGGQNNLSGCDYAPSESVDWGYLGGKVGGLLSLCLDYNGGSFSMYLLQKALSSSDGWTKAFNVLGTALSTVSLILDLGVFFPNPNPRLAAFGIALGGTAIILSLAGIAYSYFIPGDPVTQEDKISLGLGVASTVISATVYFAGY